MGLWTIRGTGLIVWVPFMTMAIADPPMSIATQRPSSAAHELQRPKHNQHPSDAHKRMNAGRTERLEQNDSRTASENTKIKTTMIEQAMIECSSDGTHALHTPQEND